MGVKLGRASSGTKSQARDIRARGGDYRPRECAPGGRHGHGSRLRRQGGIDRRHVPARTWGDVRQLHAVSRELLARAFAAGRGSRRRSPTVDLDSTIVETYGLNTPGARHHLYTGVRGCPSRARNRDSGRNMTSGRGRDGAAHRYRSSRCRSARSSGSATFHMQNWPKGPTVRVQKRAHAAYESHRAGAPSGRGRGAHPRAWGMRAS